MIEKLNDLCTSLLGLSMILLPFAAWITHIIFCVKAAAYTGSATDHRDFKEP